VNLIEAEAEIWLVKIKITQGPLKQEKEIFLKTFLWFRS